MNNKKHKGLCSQCNKTTDKILSDELRRGSGIVFFCESCDYGFLVPDKNFNEQEYYAKEYRKEYSHFAEANETNPDEIFNTYKDYQKDRLRIISPYLKKKINLLEVGASAGQFLVHIKDRTQNINAIELDKNCSEYITNQFGIKSDSNILSNSIFANETYDVVCSFQVMEHVLDPKLFLIDLKKSTKKGGLIFVEVPNLNDPLLSVWNVKAYRKFFYHAAHLHYFTERSLRNLATQAGFFSTSIEFIYTQDYNILNHIHWILNHSPQINCHPGLGEISFHGSDREISDWLTKSLVSLNKTYISKLISKKATSNIMLILRND
jgi:2-polyprenyl-3-methyl-5-hydroxy-6-metoxy-1,4-benzoquinol methylase